MAESESIQVRIPQEMKDWLEDRANRFNSGSPALQAREELNLLKSLLAQELRRIPLTVDEASCLVDVMNSTMLDNATGSFISWELSEVFQFEAGIYATKWKIDEASLLEKMRGLCPTADHALRDAISRWWSLGLEPNKKDFEKVGMRIVD